MSILLNLLTGKLLGDGCITKQRGRKPRFQFIHSISDKEWCFHCYEELKSLLPLRPPSYKFVPDVRTIKGFTESFYVQSRTHPIITWLESVWYDNRKKILPFDFLELYLNDLALAWWYQDDGSLSQVDGKHRKIILSTDNFTQEENHQLIDLLKRKFHLSFKLDSQNRLLLYDQLQICYFLRLVEPYIHPSMKRKTIKQSHLHKTFKRTTIYLPRTIKLIKPTYEINKQLQNLYTIERIILDRERYIEFYRSVIIPFLEPIGKTKAYQIVINEQYHEVLQVIKSKTGLTVSQIITLCFLFEYFYIKKETLSLESLSEL